MAMMTRWEPFRDLARLQDEVNRMFDDRAFRGGESVGWTPACDIYEDDGVRDAARSSSPGSTRRTSTSASRTGSSRVRGERKLERDEQRENYHRVERAYGTFTRSFSLPGTLDRRADQGGGEERGPHDHPSEEGRGEAARHPGEGGVTEP